jgi:hydrogenase maturation protease
VTSWLGLEGGLQSADVLAADALAADALAADALAADVVAADAAPLSLVLGFGNVLLGDDGAGVQLVKRLRLELGADTADFIDAGTLSFSLLPYIEATTSMLAIDAAEINALPGTINLFEGLRMDQFLSSTRRRSVHEVGLIDLLDMARLRDCLPPRRALLCIQPGRIDWSEDLSVPVEEALDEAGRQVVALLKRWNNS